MRALHAPRESAEVTPTITADVKSLDLLTASWFVRENAPDLRYSNPHNCWYFRKEGHWVRCSEDEVRRRVVRTAQSIIVASRSTGKGGTAAWERSKRLRSCAPRLREYEGLRQMIALARLDPAIQTDLFIEAEVGNQ